MKTSRSRRFALSAAVIVGLTLSGPASAHDDDGSGDTEHVGPHDPSAPLIEHDAARESIVSDGPSGKQIKNMDLVGRGERLDAGATTDVWAHNGYAYTGTFNSPCGGEDGAGIWVWNVETPTKPDFVTVIESETGSRSNDVKVASMNSGDILVHSNETCGPGGGGGFEVYNVDDPANPQHLSTVRVHDANQVLRETFGVVNVGVHNLFLFTRGDRDYVGAQVEGEFGGFQIFELTDPADPEFVSAWGAEYLCEGDFCSEDPHAETDPNVILDVIFDWMRVGFGNSQHKYLHDLTVTQDGKQVYLSHWDAGLVLLDIEDPADPQVVSVAMDPENGSLDGEVNSHSAWPSSDGSIVVEGEEDFDAWVGDTPPTNLTFGEGDPAAPLPGVAVGTNVGDDFAGSPTGNSGTVDADSLEVTSGPLAGATYPAAELSGDQPKFDDVGPQSGEFVFIGRACNGDEIRNAEAIGEGGIAIVRRGACTFRDKNFNAANAGATAVVIANNLEDTPWSGLRIWDYSDPESPVLASTFDTVCSASAKPIPQCDPAGTYSVHNVIVEETDDGRVLAYVSWYSDGMLVLDVTDPYNPVEIARYFDDSAAFLESNGGEPHDFWGVDKEPGEPWIYGSDRNGGLSLFKLKGAGSGKK